MEFDDDIEFSITEQSDPNDFRRDRWGRPLIRWNGSDMVFARVSTVAEMATNHFGIDLWRKSAVGRAIALCDEKYRRAIIEAGDDDSRVREIVDLAINSTGGHKARDWGTLLHEATQQTVQWSTVPEVVHEAVGTYRQLLTNLGLEPIPGTDELKVVNMGIRTAGSIDRVYRCQKDIYSPMTGMILVPAGTCVAADLKTGKPNPLSHSAQLAQYAYAEPYNPATNRFITWPGHNNPDRRIGFIVNITRDGVGRVLSCDLNYGYRLAQVCASMYWTLKDAHDFEEV